MPDNKNNPPKTTKPFWKSRAENYRGGSRRLIFENGQELWEAACEYFQWMDDNPIYTVKPFSTKNGVKDHTQCHPRPYTLSSLCIFLRIDQVTWFRWRREVDELKDWCITIDEIIRTQKFEGASVGIYNANLIMRDLGMADKQEVSGPNGGPVETNINSGMTPKEAAEKYQDSLRGGDA